MGEWGGDYFLVRRVVYIKYGRAPAEGKVPGGRRRGQDGVRE